MWLCGTCWRKHDEVMPDYRPPVFRAPKKKLSHISEGRESAITRSTALPPAAQERLAPLDKAAIEEHDFLADPAQRFYGSEERSLPSSPKDGDSSRRRSGSGERSSPNVSSGEDKFWRNSREDSGSAAHSIMVMRPSLESGSAGEGRMDELDSMPSGVSWVPDMPVPEAVERRRRRSAEMLGGRAGERQRAWDARAPLDSVNEVKVSKEASTLRDAQPPTHTLGNRLNDYLRDQLQWAAVDAARRRRLDHAAAQEAPLGDGEPD